MNATLESALSPSEWDKIKARIEPEHGLLTGAWFSAWAQHLLPCRNWEGPVRYAVARDASAGILAVIPFAIQKFGIFRFQSLGGYYFPLRAFPVARTREDEAAAALFELLAHRCTDAGFRFGPVERGDPFLSALVKQFRSAGWSLVSREVGDEYLLHLPATVDALHCALSRKLRTNASYCERRMHRDGRVRIELVNDAAPACWGEAIRAMAAVEAQSWVGQAGGHLHFGDERNARFWSDLLATASGSRAAKAWIMYFNDTPGAFYFAVDSGSCRYFIAGLYTGAVAGYSPGSILMQRMLTDAIEQRISIVNMGLGDSGYKARWGARPERKLEDWVALRPGLLNKGFNAAWSMRALLEGIRRAATGAAAAAAAKGRAYLAES